MKITTCKATGKIIRQPETMEERKFLKAAAGMNTNRNTQHNRFLKPQGTQTTVRRQMRDASANGLTRHPHPNNRAMTPSRSKLTQVIELTTKVVDRVYPDGATKSHREPYSPARYKTITHAHQGWIR